MEITNGSVTRKFRPADYEERVIGVSFTVAPGDDAEECLAIVVAMVERQIRTVRAEAAPSAQPAETSRGRRTSKPAVVETKARLVEEPAPAAAVVEEPAPAAAVVEEPTPEPAATVVEEPEKELSNADINAAIASTHQRLATQFPELAGPDHVKDRGDLIRNLRDKITETVGMSVQQMNADQRARFIAGLKALKPAS